MEGQSVPSFRKVDCTFLPITSLSGVSPTCFLSRRALSEAVVAVEDEEAEAEAILVRSSLYTSFLGDLKTEARGAGGRFNSVHF